MPTITYPTYAKLRTALGSVAAAEEIRYALDTDSFYGKTFYVSSAANSNGISGSNGNSGLSPDAPLATIDYAIGLCTANKGDRIFVLPGHTETISAAAGIACDVAGITIQGFGNGSLRPTITWSAVGSTWTVSAANVTIRNIRCTSSVDEMVKMFHVTAANCTLDAVDVFETAACQIIQFILTTNAADNLTIRNCKHVQRTAAAATQIWIQLVGVNDAVIRDNLFLLTLKNETGSYTLGGTTACVDSFVYRNTFVQEGGNTQDKIASFVTTSTGTYRENCAGSGTGVAITSAFVGDAMFHFDNKWLDTVGTSSGLLTPAVDTDT